VFAAAALNRAARGRSFGGIAGLASAACLVLLVEAGFYPFESRLDAQEAFRQRTSRKSMSASTFICERPSFGIVPSSNK
jgi:hypothetical protein